MRCGTRYVGANIGAIATGRNFCRNSMLVILMAVLAVAGCSNEDCTRQLASVTNSEGTLTALLEVSICGGATVGYTTDLKIMRIPKPFLRAERYVWTVKGSVEADLKWLGPKQLEVQYPPSLKDDDVVQKITRWFDVEIVYRPRSSS
jgi:hypothetical protein